MKSVVDVFPSPGELSEEQKKATRELGRLWAKDRLRPRPPPQAILHWDKLVIDWSKDDSLPLYVRKNSLGRGSAVTHDSGRSIVPTDNSPATWAFSLALGNQRPTLKDVSLLVKQDRIPIAMILKKVEKSNALYKCTISNFRKDNPNSRWWTTRHIAKVGLKIRFDKISIKHADIGFLQGHFRKFMSPSNMFVVRKEYAGLAEVPEFYEQMTHRNLN